MNVTKTTVLILFLNSLITLGLILRNEVNEYSYQKDILKSYNETAIFDTIYLKVKGKSQKVAFFISWEKGKEFIVEEPLFSKTVILKNDFRIYYEFDTFQNLTKEEIDEVNKQLTHEFLEPYVDELLLQKWAIELSFKDQITNQGKTPIIIPFKQ